MSTAGALGDAAIVDAAIAEACAALPAHSRRVLVGYSGGLDSSVLLHALQRQARFELRALHVHHGLHAAADDWAEHCRQCCADLRVPLAIEHVAVIEQGLGPEAAARHARQHAYAAHLADADLLALAHHRDDQAETFMLRALRAAGPDGLAAMRMLRPFATGLMWRPLLRVPQATLRDYALAHGLRWVEDPSNRDSAFDRNYLRQQVMPLLRARWPEADAALAHAAQLAADAHDLLSIEDDKALAAARHHGDPHTLNCPRLLQLPPERRARVIRRWVQQLGLPPLPGNAIAHIQRDLLDARADAEASYRWGAQASARIERWAEQLHAAPRHTTLAAEWSTTWDGRTPLPLPDGSVLSLSGASGFVNAVQVRPRLGGERLQLANRQHSSTLKQLLQTGRVPPWRRRRLPLLVDAESGQVLAAGDLFIAANFHQHTIDPHAQLHWQLA